MKAENIKEAAELVDMRERITQALRNTSSLIQVRYSFDLGASGNGRCMQYMQPVLNAHVDTFANVAELGLRRLLSDTDVRLRELGVEI